MFTQSDCSGACPLCRLYERIACCDRFFVINYNYYTHTLRSNQSYMYVKEHKSFGLIYVWVIADVVGGNARVII